MSKRILHIVSCAYRATIEEQDDPIVWLSRAMRAGGGSIDVLLDGNAVSYAVRDQDASGLAFGERRQTWPPRLVEEVSGLTESGASVYFNSAAARERSIMGDEMIEGLTSVEPASLPELFARYDLVLNW